ncbi:MAG TPA: two-component regulator propeller domain-containing protein, partial [Chryseolinea sp.]|nr:two-component regulator propeller domain-containing protein [Chryseolinea sp.]
TNDMINDIIEIGPQKFIVAQNLEGPRLLENDRIGSLSRHSNITLNRFYRTGNRLLAATDQHGMMEWREDDFHQINPARNNGMDAMAVLNDSLWITMQTNGAVQVVTNQVQPYSAVSIINATIVYSDLHHRTWMGTTNGLRLLDPRQQRNKPVGFIPLPPPFDLPAVRNTWITDFLEDSKGNCWIATTGHGVVRIAPDGKVIIYTEADGLPASFINCVWEDREKNIWVGTPLGLAKFSTSNEVEIFTAKHGLSKGATGYILPASANSIRLFDGQAITELDLLTDSFDLISAYNAPANGMYKIKKEELLLTDKGKAELYRRNKPDPEKLEWPDIKLNNVARIDEDIFIGSVANRLFAISGGRVRGELSLSPEVVIYFLLPDKNGNLWVATFNNGLLKFKWRTDGNSISLELTDSLVQELPDRHIRTLFCDKENELWIGTRYKGVIRMQEHEKGKYEMQRYGTEQGLSSNFVRTINRDRKGNIWVGTPQGVDKLIPLDDHYRIFNFGKINNIYHLVQDIWFLENDYFVTEGLVLVHARDLQQDTLPAPPVYITKIGVGSAAQDSTGTTRISELSYRRPQIYFEFCAPQFINEEWNEYRYRLLGSNDTNWLKAANTRSVYFASLQPGDYTFEVKVLGFNGEWGQAARHHFIVTTPFWKKGWFILLIIAIVAAIIYALYRYRIRQLIRLQQVRNQIAADLHDEIGSNLTNISILSSLSKRNILQPQQATEFLQRISEEVAASSQSLDDIIWSVNANHDTLEETVARMRLYTAELFEAAGIRYELQLDPAFEATRLIMEQRRDIYMIYKEAVNNVLKHARAAQVLISIAIADHQLVLHIKDDGIGFDRDKVSHRHGLEGIKARVKRWNGKIQVETVPGKGTSLHVTLPLVS